MLFIKNGCCMDPRSGLCKEMDIGVMIDNLTDEMLSAAEMLEFERAAELRDKIQLLKEKIK